MILERTIKDERGTFNITVSLWILDRIYSYNSKSDEPKFRYNVQVAFIPKGKRKELYGNMYTELLLPKEILDLKLEFWNMIKPK